MIDEARIPTIDTPNDLTLVWDDAAPLVIETITVRRKVIRDTRRGGHVTAEVAISLPRVRFLEDATDAPTSEDAAPAISNLADGDDFPLAA
jgi:hypothetical protein